MRLRHVLALLILSGGLCFVSACGDDNDTPIAVAPTNTQAPQPTSPPVVNTPTNTAEVTRTGPAFTPTSTPTRRPTGSGIEFTCNFSTALTCEDGPNAGQACNPFADDCAGADCEENIFFCKGGPNPGASCERPQRTRTPDPCSPGRCQNSELQICNELACPVVSRRISGGQIDAQCEDDGSNCAAELRRFDPVNITGIGLVCVRPVPLTELTCPTGTFSCEGGPGLDYDLLQNHSIGACQGNAECQTACESYCSEQSRTMVDFGCTGYCKSGPNQDLACNCDSVTGTCSGADCPQASCNGKDNATPADRNVCGCQCLLEGGNPSRPGAINFRVGAQIIVETGPPCDEGPVLLRLPPQCIPLTTESAAGVLLNANNNVSCPGPACVQIPPSGQLQRSGLPVDCADLEAGTVTGMNIVGNISFFDSTIGDLETELDWFCQ